MNDLTWIIPILITAFLALVGFFGKRFIVHLDKIDTSIQSLRTDIAILFDRGRGLPGEAERRAVEEKLSPDP